MKRVMFFIDGENLVFRYEAMVDKGWKARDGVIHIPEVFVWHPNMIRNEARDIIRISCYTSAVGTTDHLEELSDQIKNVAYQYRSERSGGGNNIYGGGTFEHYSAKLVPRIFKKDRKQTQSKAVDINIAVDVLTIASTGSVDTMYLITGDGDFVPLVTEVMRCGIRMNVMALSDGLSTQLKLCPDSFECLDDIFFESKPLQNTKGHGS